MKAKKVLGLLLSVAMAAGLLTGCGNGDSGNSSNGGVVSRAAGRRATAGIQAAEIPAAVKPAAERLAAERSLTRSLFTLLWILRFPEALTLCAGPATAFTMKI